MPANRTTRLRVAGLAAAVTVAAVGCDHRKTSSPPPPAVAPVTVAPPAPPPAPAEPSVAGTYKAEMRDPRTDQPFMTTLLTLSADGTMTLDTKVAGSPNGLAPVENTAAGRYAVDGPRVTLTLAVGNGRPIPPDAGGRVMTFDRSADGRRLSNDTGVPPFVRQD